MNTTTLTSGNTSGNNAVGSVADRAHQAVDRAADKAAPVLDRASAAAHRTIDNAAAAATPAAEWASENGRQLAARSSEFADVCSGYVRARPLMTVAGALAIGYFAGKLLR